MAAHRTGRGNAVVVGLVAAAALGGLGVASGRAAPGQLTGFEIAHFRFLSVVGTHQSDVSLTARVRKLDYDGKPYWAHDEVGTGNLTVQVTDQRGARFTIGAMKLQPAQGYTPNPYDDGGDEAALDAKPDTDELAPGVVSSGNLRYRRRTIRHPGYAPEHVDSFDWTSSTKLKEGTLVKLSGTAMYGGGSYGEFEFDGGSKASGGIVETLAPGKTRVYVSDFRIATTGGTLVATVAWSDDTRGTVTFAEPSYLAGKTGTIRRAESGDGDVYTVTGPKGYGVKLTIRADGSGVVNMGLGRFAVDYGSFSLQFE